MKSKLLRPFASSIAAALVALSSSVAFGVEDEKWGEAWNTPSVIGLANMTIDSNQDWNGHKADGVRGAATELFDNVNDTNNDMLHTMSNGKLWVKMTVAADCQKGKDLVLKKYRISANSTARAPKTWSIYGTTKADAAWGDKSLVLIDSRLNVAGTTSADYDCSANAGAYRTYFFYFEANNGDGLLQIKELYLFGEIKDHQEAIVYSVSLPYSGFYDGYAHGITVTPSYPETGVTVEYSEDNANWQAESPAYKDVGEYTIYYRLTASGFPDVSGSRTITILEPPQEKLDITAVVRDAENASGVTYHQTTAANAFLGQAEFTDGINNQRIGWATGYADGRNTLTYEIYDTYRPGDEVTVTGLTFIVGSGVDHSATDSMRAWKFEAWDADDGEWRELVSKTAGEWQPWAAEDLDSSLSAYVRSAFFENTFVARKYRLTTYARTFLSDLRILGNVKMADNTKIQCRASDYSGTYDGEAHGISVTVQNPEQGYAISYRALPAGAWTDENPTFVGPIPAFQAQRVEWKVEAEGFETVVGTNSVVIGYQDLTAKLREAGGEYYGVSATGHFFDPASEFVDGNENQRKGWTGGSDGTFTYVVSNTYEQGKAVIVKGVGFAVSWANVSADGGYAIMPRYFALEGWDEDAGQWSTIVDRRENPLPEWSEDDKVGDVYRKRLDFDNPYAFRTYRLLMPKGHRQHVAEIRLFGIVAASAAKEILCTASDYVGLYDGEAHGISLEVTRPAGANVEYSLDGKTWLHSAPQTKGLVSEPCPVYWRVSAPGYATKTGVNTIQITDNPHVDLDLTAAVREAGTEVYSVWAANGGFWQQGSGTPYNFVNGKLNDRNGWVDPKTGTGILYIAISNEFRVAEDIVVKAVAFAGPTNSDYVINGGKIVLPTDWAIEGSADGETWVSLAAYNAENYPAWGEDDIVGANYYRRSDFANAASYRLYRLKFTGSRIHISEIYLYGDVGKAQPERPPRAASGYMLFVR